MDRTLFARHVSRHPGPLARLWTALAVARQRHRLAALDDHLLRDIGIDRATAAAEAARPVWDVPVHWLR
ncbi:MAG: DUF1127 domain-containing protein [Paracoccaceae bacterium]